MESFDLGNVCTLLLMIALLLLVVCVRVRPLTLGKLENLRLAVVMVG